MSCIGVNDVGNVSGIGKNSKREHCNGLVRKVINNGRRGSVTFSFCSCNPTYGDSHVSLVGVLKFE